MAKEAKASAFIRDESDISKGTPDHLNVNQKFMQTIVTLSTIFTFVIASILSINIIISNPNNHPDIFNDKMKAGKNPEVHQGYSTTSMVVQGNSVKIQTGVQ